MKYIRDDHVYYNMGFKTDRISAFSALCIMLYFIFLSVVGRIIYTSYIISVNTFFLLLFIIVTVGVVIVLPVIQTQMSSYNLILISCNRYQQDDTGCLHVL